jgi:predicted ATP-grasp superfamily ATP-dependent carboligase
MSETGLSALRLLGRVGVRCHGVDVFDTANRRAPAYWSRYYCGGAVLPHRATDEEVLSALDEVAASVSLPPVILPTSDRYVRLTSRCRDQLQRSFRLLLPEAALIEDLLDKDRFARRAQAIQASVPRTGALRGLSDLPVLAAELGLPLILKPARREGLVLGLPKALRIEKQEEIAVAQAKYAGCPEGLLVVQEYVPGPDTHHVSVAVCLDRRCEVLMTFTSRKRRQGNGGAGVGTYVERIDEPEAEANAVALLRSLGYVGVAEVEFKRHARTGKLYVIEINPRLWSQTHLAGACGLNFPHLMYCLAAGLPLPALPAKRRIKSWQDLWGDFYEVFRRDGYHATGEVSVMQWLGQSLRAGAGPYFAFDDLLPVAAHALSVARENAGRR